VMRINFERTGGFANVPLRAEIDSAEMEPKRAEELRRLVERALPFDQSKQSQAPSTMSDHFQYEISIEDGGQTHELRTGEEAASDDLKQLFDFLSEEALSKLERP
jgi:hypothetical protein